MAHNAPWEVYHCSTNPEIPRLLSNSEFHCIVHRRPPRDPVLTQIKPVHALSCFLRYILMLSSSLR
jgi:hypothetical protein